MTRTEKIFKRTVSVISSDPPCKKKQCLIYNGTLNLTINLTSPFFLKSKKYGSHRETVNENKQFK